MAVRWTANRLLTILQAILLIQLSTCCFESISTATVQTTTMKMSENASSVTEPTPPSNKTKAGPHVPHFHYPQVVHALDLPSLGGPWPKMEQDDPEASESIRPLSNILRMIYRIRLPMPQRRGPEAAFSPLQALRGPETAFSPLQVLRGPETAYNPLQALRGLHDRTVYRRNFSSMTCALPMMFPTCCMKAMFFTRRLPSRICFFGKCCPSSEGNNTTPVPEMPMSINSFLQDAGSVEPEKLDYRGEPVTQFDLIGVKLGTDGPSTPGGASIAASGSPSTNPEAVSMVTKRPRENSTSRTLPTSVDDLANEINDSHFLPLGNNRNFGGIDTANNRNVGGFDSALQRKKPENETSLQADFTTEISTLKAKSNATQTSLSPPLSSSNRTATSNSSLEVNNTATENQNQTRTTEGSPATTPAADDRVPSKQAINKSTSNSSTSAKSSEPSVVKCPKDKTGPNCTIDISQTMSDNGVYLHLTPHRQSFEASRKVCQSRNMTLFQFDDRSKNQSIADEKLVRRLLNGVESGSWIGLSRSKGDRSYRWENGDAAGPQVLQKMAPDLTFGSPTKHCMIRLLRTGPFKVECTDRPLEARALCMYRSGQQSPPLLSKIF